MYVFTSNKYYGNMFTAGCLFVCLSHLKIPKNFYSVFVSFVVSVAVVILNKQ